MHYFKKGKADSIFDMQRGFSSIELIIVAIIFSVLCVLSIPKIVSSLQLNRLNTTTAAISSKLSEARILAVKRNGSVSLVVNKLNKKMWIEAGGAQIGLVEPFPGEIQIQTSPDNGSNQEVVTFNSFGYLKTVPLTITSLNSKIGYKKSLQVSLSGKITTQNTVKATL